LAGKKKLRKKVVAFLSLKEIILQQEKVILVVTFGGNDIAIRIKFHEAESIKNMISLSKTDKCSQDSVSSWNNTVEESILTS
jgi:hypothetical protein